VDALYAFTDCEVSITSRIIVIKDNRPVEMTVFRGSPRNTVQLVAIHKRELELKERQLQEELHFRTLERIFIEERIYKKIEQCKTNEAVVAAVFEGLKPSASSSSATSAKPTWTACCKCGSAGFRFSTSTSIGRKWKRPGPNSPKRRKA